MDQFGELIVLVSGLVIEASSGILMMLDTMATFGVNKLARETGLTATQQEVEKGRVQISLSSPANAASKTIRWA